jgi:hypothetical protein
MGRRYKAFLGQNEKNVVFLGEERKKYYLCKRRAFYL